LQKQKTGILFWTFSALISSQRWAGSDIPFWTFSALISSQRWAGSDILFW